MVQRRLHVVLVDDGSQRRHRPEGPPTPSRIVICERSEAISRRVRLEIAARNDGAGGVSQPASIGCSDTLPLCVPLPKTVPVSALTEWRASFGQLAQQARRRPSFAILLMPTGDLRVDAFHADAVSPVHQPTPIAREAKAVQPHYVDVAGVERPCPPPECGRLRLTDENNSRCRISVSVKDFCGTPSAAAADP